MDPKYPNTAVIAVEDCLYINQNCLIKAHLNFFVRDQMEVGRVRTSNSLLTYYISMIPKCNLSQGCLFHTWADSTVIFD